MFLKFWDIRTLCIKRRVGAYDQFRNKLMCVFCDANLWVFLKIGDGVYKKPDKKLCIKRRGIRKKPFSKTMKCWIIMDVLD